MPSTPALADRPFFVPATARPSIDDLFPKPWEERVPQELRVGPRSPKASEKIVRIPENARVLSLVRARATWTIAPGRRPRGGCGPGGRSVILLRG